MTGAPESPEPDPVMQTALQRLPVPDHGAAFWSDLAAALDAEPERLVEPALAPGPVSAAARPTEVVPRLPTAGSTPDDPASRRLIPEELRSRANAALAAIAVTAMLLVLVAGVLLLRAHSGGV
ncbi:MAG: hypothetical protein ACT4OV_11695 [Microthrixaceae bacterium]